MRIRLPLAIAALLALAVAAPAQAAPTVSNTNDAGAGSLRQAIAEAGPGETITVPAGTYSLSSEPLLIQKNLTLAGAGANATIIRSVGPYRVFTIVPPALPNLEVTLSDMMIRDGRAFLPEAFGAGILAEATNLTLSRVNLTGNIVNANGEPGEKGDTAIGGGMLLVGGLLTVADSQVSGNTAESLGGSGFAGGQAQGGGLVVINGALKVERSTLSGNIANAGGGQGPVNAGQDGGTAAGGGIIVIAETTPSSVVASNVGGNVAEALPGAGGAAGEVIGGGLFAVTGKGQPIALTNSTITGNVVRNGPGEGKIGAAAGVFFVAAVGGTVTVTSTTIAANRLESSTPESRGGNVFAASDVPGAVVFRNSIVANGVGPAGSENCFISETVASIASQGFNLDSKDQCTFKGAGDKVNTDPLLGPLQANGGPTQTMAPAANSPVVDQGAAFGLTTDQRGVQRPIDLPTIPNSAVAGADGSDIGAHELQPSNALTLGKLKKNKKKGTATLSVNLPQPSAGTLTLTGKGLKKQTLAITGQATVKLKVAAKSRAVKKALKKRGKRKVKLDVTYTPTGNTAATKSKTTKLVKKRKKHRKKRSKGGNR